MKILIIPLLAALLTSFYVSYERGRRMDTPIDPRKNPGLVCDLVAERSESKPTVGWYYACLHYAAKVQAEQK